MFESIKSLKIQTSMILNVDFANNTILSWFFFLLIIELYFLIPAFIAQVFNFKNSIAELVIPIGISS